MPSLVRAAVALLALLSVGAIAGCRGDDLVAPPSERPPFLAILTTFDAPAGAFLGTEYQYRIQAIAEGVQIDTIVSAAPTDTIIIPVRPADYVVTVSGLPTSCSPRRGTQQGVFIPEDANTGVVRYFIICDPKLGIELVTDGRQRDSAFVFRISGPGIDSVGITTGLERLTFPQATAGRYRFELANIADNCLVTSPYASDVPIDVPAVGGTVVSVRVTCSEPARRPRVISAVSRALEGVVTMYITATDPDRDIERIFWELTDCNGVPLRADGRRIRQNFTASGAVVRDTSIIATVFDVDLTVAELQTRCSLIHLFDFDGNSTTSVEVPIRAPTESAPIATTFNALIVEERALVVQLAVDDPQRDQSSVFPLVRLRDGVLGDPDGRIDLGIYAPAGYLSAADIPELRIGTGTRIQTFDILGVDVLLFDRAGDVRRVRDTDLRQ